MNFNGRLISFCVLLSGWLLRETSADNRIEELSCNFTRDFCSWTTKTDALNPSEFDIGWRIYSPHLDRGKFEIPQNGERFAYAAGGDDLRTFLSSPPTSLDPRLISVSFRYVTTGDASLILYILSDSGHKVIWSSNSDLEEQEALTADSDNSTLDFNKTSIETEISIDIPITSIPIDYSWKSVITPSACQFQNLPRLFQLSFVAYVKVNESVAISNVVTTKLDGVPEECAGNASESQEDRDLTTAWKFFIIFCLFLCFGAIFITALLVVGRSTKTIYVPQNIERSQDYENPSFKYRKLKDIVTF